MLVYVCECVSNLVLLKTCIFFLIDFHNTYIDFSAWYWKISIGWLSIFDELKKFPGILFQKRHLQQKEEAKNTSKANMWVSNFFLFELNTWWSIKVKVHPIQSNSISFFQFEAPTDEKSSEIDFYWVQPLFSFVKNAIDWFIWCELIYLIAFIMKWSHEIVTIFHRLAFRMQQVYVAARNSYGSQSVSHFSASARSFYAIKQTESARGDKWLCQVRVFASSTWQNQHLMTRSECSNALHVESVVIYG